MDINPYSLQGILVAKTVAAATSYEDPIDLPKDQMFTVTPVHDTDQQRDSGSVTSLLSVPTHAEGTISVGGLPFTALAMMMGASTSTSGAVVQINPKSSENRPYFGAIGTARTEDGRVLAVGLYKCQLQADPVYSLDGNTNAWLQNELSFLAAAKATVNQFMRAKIYDADSDWETAKPTDGAGFLAFFA